MWEIKSKTDHLLWTVNLTSSTGLRQNKQTYNSADTNALVAAVAFGKGLSNRRPPGVTGPVQSSQPSASTIITGASAMQQVQMPGGPNQAQPMLGGVQMPQTGQPGKYKLSDILGSSWNAKGREMDCGEHIATRGAYLFAFI